MTNMLKKFALDSEYIYGSSVVHCYIAFHNGDDPDAECLLPFVYPSLFVIHMRRWLKYFPSRILVLDGQNFVKNPLVELRKVEKFLDLEPMINGDHIYFNKTKRFFCMKTTHGNECLPRSKGRDHIDMPDGSLVCLKSFFEPFNRELSLLLNQTFEW